MNELTPRERELVALGAALGSNCAPCVDIHVAEARRAGLDDALIRAAVAVADQVRRVPAQKALDAADAALAKAPSDSPCVDAACACVAR